MKQPIEQTALEQYKINDGKPRSLSVAAIEGEAIRAFRRWCIEASAAQLDRACRLYSDTIDGHVITDALAREFGRIKTAIRGGTQP